jgi:cytochrome c oxidase cbb3-type subunit 3
LRQPVSRLAAEASTHVWRCRGLILSLALLGAPAWASNPATNTQDRHEAGRKIYNFRCYFCHGYSGDAKTLAATYLKPAPAAFTRLRPADRSRAAMLKTIRDGRPGTAMKGFEGILKNGEIELVVDFVREEFMARKAANTRYHTPENGWPKHERYRDAWPFATGTLPLDTPWDSLTERQAAGKRLFLASCVSCHDRARVKDPGANWESRAVSYPRNQYRPGGRPPVDATTSASPYVKHDIPPRLERLTTRERRGERLYQDNCAFCHAADGTGRNWIGSFMEPHPRNLADPAFMRGMTRQRLAATIRDGLPDTSMPAWGAVLKPEQIGDIVAYVAKAFHPLPER